MRRAINVPQSGHGSISARESETPEYIELYVVFFPSDLARLAKSFWQHTGTGISSRMAEYCLSVLSHQTEVSSGYPTPPLTPNLPEPSTCNNNDDMTTLSGVASPLYALPLVKAARAKQIVRQRIANLVVEDPSMEKSARIAQRVVSEDDVVLFPSGMSAIWHVHLALVQCFPRSKSVSFG
jgi:cystathionine gamma-synthase